MIRVVCSCWVCCLWFWIFCRLVCGRLCLRVLFWVFCCLGLVIGGIVRCLVRRGLVLLWGGRLFMVGFSRILRILYLVMFLL